MARLRINLFGSFQVHFNEAPITKFESNKVRALLAYLIVESQEAHSREILAALFWPEMSAKRASSNLSQALYNLRNLIQDPQINPAYLLRSRESVQFNPESDYWLDIEQFNRNLIRDQALVTSNDGVHINLQRAIELYRGDFLDGLTFDSCLTFDEWVLLLRQRFQRQVLDGLHQLAAYYAAQSELLKALPLAWRQVELDPLDERACRQLIGLLAANDQRSQALTQFERLQVMLMEELGVEPESETLALRDQIRGAELISPLDHRAGDNLPAFLVPLIGRQDEQAELQTLIRNPDCRLLTILGPGGSGKTRLAQEVARSSLETFDDGIFFVSLNPVQSPVSLLPAIVEALDLPRREESDHQKQLINYLHKKELLLILDGFEHLLEGAGLLAEILHQALGLKILVTSRTRLNIKGEYLYYLSGMHFPADEQVSPAEILSSDAVKLLLSGLRRTRRDYEPDSEEIKSLRQICQKVQGMPLGILLAASWGATLSVAEIDTEISRGLDFLAADWADVPARQRSLRATFDHTWNLLGEHTQRIFQSLSVFRGAFTRKAARAVSDASPHELRTLVDRSLLINKSPGWYEVHELLRQYGRGKLAEVDQIELEVCSRHSEYYLKQLARLGDDLKSAQQVAALANIDLEHENFRAAWNWAASQGEAAQLTRVLDALCLYYDLSLRYADGESACRAAIEGLPQDQADMDMWLLLARGFVWQSRFLRLLGQPEKASQLLGKAHDHLEKAKGWGNQASTVEAFLALEKGNNHFYNDRAAAADCYQHSLEIYRGLNDAWGIAKILGRLGLLAHHSGSFEIAVRRYSNCLEHYRSLGDQRGIANTLVELGHNSLRQGQVKIGQEYIEEGIIILQQIGDRAGVARGYLEIGRSCFWAGQFAKGNSSMEKSNPILEELGMRDKLAFSTIGISLGLSHLGKYSNAITQAMKGLPIAEEIDARREIAMAYYLLSTAYLGEKNYQRAQEWAKKSTSHYANIDQKDELAWALSLMVFVQRSLGQFNAARTYLNQTLEIGNNAHGYFPVLCGLCGAALLLLDEGKYEQAVEYAALVWTFPVAANSHWFEDIAGCEIAEVADTLPPEVVAEAQKRGRERDIWETATELLEELSEKVI